jgi:alcohol dehydrogenase
VGALNAQLHSGNVVVVVGAGPIGLSVVLGTRLHTSARVIAVDELEARVEFALKFGADAVSSPDGVQEVVDELTEGIGADVAIEAVGLPETFEMCTELVRPGGRVSNVGMHGQPATLHLESLWSKDITITTGLVDTSSIPVVMAMVESGRIEPTLFTTHRFALDEIVHAYDIFARAGDTEALKVVLER